MNILVVDDEKTIREGLKRTIGSAFADIRLWTAASAAEALETLIREQIHVVFLDIMMPGMNGLELLAEARHTYRDIKWIVVSAHSEFSYAQEALRLGARDYILKPLGKEQIIKSVDVLYGEWQRGRREQSDLGLLSSHLKYLREAVFRRWVQGLDIGRFDLSSLQQEHDRFQLLCLKLEGGPELSLVNFVAENVMTELIAQYGKGFIVNLESHFLVGVVTFSEESGAGAFKQEAEAHLGRCLKMPFQLELSGRLTDFYSIPHHLKKFHTTKAIERDDSAADNKNDAIDIAIQYIKGSFQQNLSLELVSSIVYLNPVYFSKLFKQKTGIGYKEYVTKLRMERAEELLAIPDMSVTRIAELTGYPDVRHFTQVFRKKHDCTPSQYRSGKIGI
ncbi:response regulator [Paenibacillus sp. GCM10027627]|uniref:response regulator transcription factor n=1 Tax=unclassified Paenibacillus TaxID=185978 RepID=UPI00362BF683